MNWPMVMDHLTLRCAEGDKLTEPQGCEVTPHV